MPYNRSRWWFGIKEYGNVVGGLVVDVSGTWLSGDWYGGTWDSRNIKDNLTLLRLIAAYQMIHITWINGRWYDGIWNNGTWNDGRWYDGIWNNGTW
jgi:hypothetical protein